MNIPFLNPTEYLNQHPTLLSSTLSHIASPHYHTITSLKFSNSGLYLALGLSNGRVMLLDVESRGILRRFRNGHEIYAASDVAMDEEEDSLSYDTEEVSNTQKSKEIIVSDFIWLKDTKGSIQRRFRDDLKVDVQEVKVLRTGIDNGAKRDVEEMYKPDVRVEEARKSSDSMQDVDASTTNAAPITTLATPTSRFLLSAAYEPKVSAGNIFLWDILSKSDDPIYEYQFDSGVVTMDSNPKDEEQVLVTLYYERPLLVNIITDERIQLPLDLKKDDHIVARYNRAGDRIYCGNVKGVITVLDADSLELIKTFEAESGHCIYDIQFTAKGKYYLVNADGIIKVYHASTDAFQYNVRNSDMEPRQHYWCGFSGLGPIVSTDTDSSFLYGACKSVVYIWMRSQGYEVAALNPLKQKSMYILRMAWHPTRPLLVCSGTDGNLYFYTIPIKDNWSAFAPGFEEIEVNVDYMEREDEYDDELVEEEKRRQEKDLDVLDDMREEIDILSLREPNEQSVLEYFVPLQIEQEDWLGVLEQQNRELLTAWEKNNQE